MKNLVTLGQILRWEMCAERRGAWGIGVGEPTETVPWNRKLVIFVTVS